MTEAMEPAPSIEKNKNLDYVLDQVQTHLHSQGLHLYILEKDENLLKLQILKEAKGMPLMAGEGLDANIRHIKSICETVPGYVASREQLPMGVVHVVIEPENSQTIQ